MSRSVVFLVCCVLWWLVRHVQGVRPSTSEQQSLKNTITRVGEETILLCPAPSPCMWRFNGIIIDENDSKCAHALRSPIISNSGIYSCNGNNGFDILGTSAYLVVSLGPSCNAKVTNSGTATDDEQMALNCSVEFFGSSQNPVHLTLMLKAADAIIGFKYFLGNASDSEPIKASFLHQIALMNLSEDLKYSCEAHFDPSLSSKLSKKTFANNKLPLLESECFLQKHKLVNPHTITKFDSHYPSSSSSITPSSTISDETVSWISKYWYCLLLFSIFVILVTPVYFKYCCKKCSADNAEHNADSSDDQNDEDFELQQVKLSNGGNDEDRSLDSSAGPSSVLHVDADGQNLSQIINFPGVCPRQNDKSEYSRLASTCFSESNKVITSTTNEEVEVASASVSDIQPQSDLDPDIQIVINSQDGSIPDARSFGIEPRDGHKVAEKVCECHHKRCQICSKKLDLLDLNSGDGSELEETSNFVVYLCVCCFLILFQLKLQ